jgi:hypothetical protein
MTASLVFVVGAGASKEFYLPTGKELLDRMKTSFNPIRLNPLQQGDPLYFTHSEELKEAVKKIAGSNQANNEEIWHTLVQLQDKCIWISEIAPMAPSIDNLIHTHMEDPELVKLAKLMLAQLLIEAERNSLLGFTQRGDISAILQRRRVPFAVDRVMETPDMGKLRLQGTWLAELFKLLTQEKTFNDFLDVLGRITFISFNYDRVIKYFITSVSRRYFRLNDDEVQEVIKQIKVLHPYGDLGEIGFESGEVTGFAPERVDLREVADRIRTFTEGIESQSTISSIQDSLRNAKCLIFLGFGFIELNQDILFSGDPLDVEVALGTHKGISRSDADLLASSLREKLFYGSSKTEEARRHLLSNGTKNVNLFDVYCAELIRNNSVLIRQLLRD